MNQLGYFIYKTRFLWINCKMVQFSMSTSITQSCIWESCTKQNIDYPCNLLHAQETYNTIMSMHAFGYINRCSYVFIFAVVRGNIHGYLPLSVRGITWVFYCFRDWLNIEYVHFDMNVLEYMCQSYIFRGGSRISS
jgi:hypothetical protein